MRNLKIIIAVFLAVTGILSCNTEKQAAKKQAKRISHAKTTFSDFPEAFALDCAREFPVQTSDVSTSTFHPGKKSNDDSAFVDISKIADQIARDAAADARAGIFDSFSRHPYYVKVKVPVDNYVHDTLVNEHYTTVENTAKTVYLSNLVSILTADTATGTAHIKDDQATIGKQKTWITRLGIAEAVTFLALIYMSWRAFRK